MVQMTNVYTYYIYMYVEINVTRGIVTDCGMIGLESKFCWKIWRVSFSDNKKINYPQGISYDRVLSKLLVELVLSESSLWDLGFSYA